LSKGEIERVGLEKEIITTSSESVIDGSDNSAVDR